MQTSEIEQETVLFFTLATMSIGVTRALETYRYLWFSRSRFSPQLSKTALATAERSFSTNNMATCMV